MGKKGSKKKRDQGKCKKTMKERVSILEKKLAKMEDQLADKVEQLSQRNAALLRKTNE